MACSKPCSPNWSAPNRGSKWIRFSRLISSNIVSMTSKITAPKPLSVHFAKTSTRSEEHTSELQSRFDLVCRLLLEKKKKKKKSNNQQNKNIKILYENKINKGIIE